jgi:hypothetical protein
MFFLLYSMNDFTSVTGNAALTTNTLGVLPIMPMGV